LYATEDEIFYIKHLAFFKTSNSPAIYPSLCYFKSRQ